MSSQGPYCLHWLEWCCIHVDATAVRSFGDRLENLCLRGRRESCGGRRLLRRQRHGGLTKRKTSSEGHNIVQSRISFKCRYYNANSKLHSLGRIKRENEDVIFDNESHVLHFPPGSYLNNTATYHHSLANRIFYRLLVHYDYYFLANWIQDWCWFSVCILIQYLKDYKKRFKLKMLQLLLNKIVSSKKRFLIDNRLKSDDIPIILRRALTLHRAWFTWMGSMVSVGGRGSGVCELWYMGGGVGETIGTWTQILNIKTYSLSKHI